MSTAAAQSVVGPAAASADAGYVLGINDQVEINIFGAGQSQAVRSRITEDGTVIVPYLGAIKATGLTARQLSEELTKLLKSRGIFNNPIVGVEVLQFVSNTVTVFGEVGTAGLYPLDQPLTVARLMAKAGGTRGTAADFVILRRGGAEHRIILSNGSGEWSSSTPILPGDELYVPVAPTIYIYGQVNSAGSYSIKSNMSVLQALARAGGPTLGGSQNNISLYRDGKKIKRVELDSDVRDGDVLYVHERLF
ncbi:SLBB domain-containing protein [Sphingomonas xinjiangensis]|uniref:Polysaccharide export outer membrane protein n=1 Tax=Sphingomonas xinjiangensis TaxID=643568 RepID=A0A840YJ57_9SPHN|nr:polysaccharide biosynthesis/export family protein [Sphingomonas xinjiangensis]MBB5712169.1 polysaccharide export outer membrane protein [Sphingomonas xinjiangensis]